MIEVITGKPGSGKTYLAVLRLMELEKGKYVVFHNIDGLKHEKMPEPEHYRYVPPDDLPQFITRAKQEEYATAVREKYDRAMLVVVDEAQMYFAERNDARKGWLSWHRHLGQDVILICQHYKMIHGDYYNLAEYEIRALKSLLLNQMVYQYRVGGETFKTMRKGKKASVYAAYQSFQGGEVAKRGFKMLYWLGGGVLLVVVLWLLLMRTLGGKVEAATEKKEVKSAKGVSATVKKVDEKKKSDPWEGCSYQGVMGGRVLVSYEGALLELSEVVGQKYLLVDAGARGCQVMTVDQKYHVVRRRAQERGADVR